MLSLGLSITGTRAVGSEGAILPILPPASDPEASLTPNLTYAAGSSGIDMTSLGRWFSVGFATDLTGLDGSAGGLIFEGGGSATGAYAGFRANGDLVWRVGSGAAPWDPDTAYHLVPAAEAPSGEGTLTFDYNRLTGAATIRWNGIELPGTKVAVADRDWGGTDVATYLAAAANTALGEVADRAVTYGTASDLRVYYGQAFDQIDPLEGAVPDRTFVEGTEAIAIIGNFTNQDSTILRFRGAGITIPAGGGMIMEGGGGGAGFYMGVRSDETTAVLRIGGGLAPWDGTTSYITFPATLLVGTHDFIISVTATGDTDPLGLTLLIDGTEVTDATPGVTTFTATRRGWIGTGSTAQFGALGDGNTPNGEVVDRLLNWSYLSPLEVYDLISLESPPIFKDTVPTVLNAEDGAAIEQDFAPHLVLRQGVSFSLVSGGPAGTSVTPGGRLIVPGAASYSGTATIRASNANGATDLAITLTLAAASGGSSTTGLGEVTLGDTDELLPFNPGVAPYDQTYTTLADGTASLTPQDLWAGPRYLVAPSISRTVGSGAIAQGDIFEVDAEGFILFVTEGGGTTWPVPSLSGQWYGDGNPIAGETGPELITDQAYASVFYRATATQTGLAADSEDSNTITGV